MPTTAIKLPLKDELLSAMKVAETSVEGAEYLQERFTQIVTKAKMVDSSKDILNSVRDFVDLVKFKMLSSAQPWMGESAASTDFKTMQRNIAKDAAHKLRALDPGPMHLDVAIDDNGDFLQGLSSQRKALDSAKLEYAHKLLNAWLAENNIVSRNSTLHECDEHGEIIVQDQNAQKQTVERVKELFDDQQNGFTKYMQDEDFSLTTQQHQYSAVKGEDKKPVAAQAAVAEVAERSQPENNNQEPGIKSGM